MIEKTLYETGQYFRLGFREIFKIRGFITLYLLAITGVAFVIDRASISLQTMTNTGGITFQFFSSFLILAFTYIYFMQRIIQTHKRISVGRNFIIAGSVWFFVFLQLFPWIAGQIALVGDDFLFVPLIKKSNPETLKVLTESQVYAFYVLEAVVLALAAGLFSYVPILILEKLQKPFRQSFALVHKHYGSICLVWFSCFFVKQIFVRILIKQALIGSAEALIHLQISIADFQILSFVILTLAQPIFPTILTVVLASAYLRETGETSFADIPTVPKLLKL